jgi:hypothetical protein
MSLFADGPAAVAITQEDIAARAFIERTGHCPGTGEVNWKSRDARQKMVYGDRRDADRMGRWMRLSTRNFSWVRTAVAKRVKNDELRASRAGVYL